MSRPDQHVVLRTSMAVDSRFGSAAASGADSPWSNPSRLNPPLT